MRRSSLAETGPARTDDEAEAKAAFHLRMRAQGIRDLGVLRAFELVPRGFFVAPRYEALAARDLALPIGCGQTLNEPWLVARMIEALGIEPAHRVLEIGAGSGYATAILAQLATEVIGVERFQSLAAEANARLAELGFVNAAVVWGDGLNLPRDLEPFDRILVHGIVSVPPSALDYLTANGRLVCAATGPDGDHITRYMQGGGEDVLDALSGACRLQPLVSGLAAAL